MGLSAGTWDFSVDLGKVNPTLLSQAVRVYESNSHQRTSRVKTRGEVVGSTRKIYRQKGTGNARHGARYAPIFVGGGVAHGPKGVRAANLVLPQKMRIAALKSALAIKLDESNVVGLDKTNKADGKTSSAAALLSKVASHPKKKVLIVTSGKTTKLYKGISNLQGVQTRRADLLNAYDLVKSDQLIVTKKALDVLSVRFGAKVATPKKSSETKTAKKADKPKKSTTKKEAK